MSLLNFREISSANNSDGNQDSFELFAREFFERLGFKIAVNPDRGQDGGRDIIIIEKRDGILNNSEVKWLVSCKHKAHSGKSVIVSDEEDISDRVRAHGCDGFIGFYSTVTSSGLNTKLGKLNEFEVQIFDHERIERVLLNNEALKQLIRRFFPISYNKINIKSPSNLFTEYMPLKCTSCGKDLLYKDISDKYGGVVVFVEEKNNLEESNVNKKIVDIYYACKGTCDKNLAHYYFSLGYTNGWNDISDLIIPYKFLQFCVGVINGMRNGKQSYTDEAFEKLKHFIIAISQIVMKNQSEEDVKRIIDLQSIPKGL